MAGSRIEKFGTIYSRLQGLLKSGALSEVDCPVWKSVYEAFPPQKEPMHERPVPEQKVRPILYPEDFVRVKYYNTFGNTDVVDLGNESVKTTCQKFVEKYFDLQEKGVQPEDLFDKTTEILKTENARLRSVDEHAEMISAQEASSKEDGEKL
ncbi:28S ribosomal protein S23, mitochondrial-like [Haliotis rufescens]|uniref:28S ribosomal protein S23, mitochondrial-like n=1 Tax=Haliotis rufescens TaxID=6454 RepID=UPI00201F9364|nr:28S ribosomal protein S23, mitochondrial-like [Haliotis rufescens]